MKKIFNFMMIALVAMVGFASCSEDCDHNVVVDDHSADLVGIWTCFQEGFAEALVIDADGSMVATGVAGDKFWEGVNGNITVKDGKATLDFEDDVTIEGHFDIIPGIAFSIKQENGERVTFNYCKEDLSEEILGMWVCNESSSNVNIQTYNADGSTIATGVVPSADSYMLNTETTYKIVGDLLFTKVADKLVTPGTVIYYASRLLYTPNGTNLGDIMSKLYYISDTEMVNYSWLRIKQTLDLPGMKYDYIKTFVTNVKGLDKDIEFMGTTFNFAKMDGVKMDKALKAILFNVEFPDANTIKYNCYYNGQNMSMEAPIAVDGNKMTVKMSKKNPAYKDTDLYTFQDQDNTQMHMYMPTYAFENFFGNMQVTIMEQMGLLDTTDEAAVKAVFDSIDEAVETINVSFVMEASK